MTEPTPASTVERCTSILLDEIVGHMMLPDFFQAMGVSRLWREHIINHPAYYGQLILFERGRGGPPGSGSSDLFLLRLSRSAGRPISIRVELDDLRPIMPAIAEHLAHIQHMTLQQAADHPLAPVFEALCGPADILSSLALKMPESVEVASEVPPNLLAGRAPELETVALCNMSLPNEMPHCFHNVKTLIFRNLDFDLVRELPSPFDRCPNLRELVLSQNVSIAEEARHDQCSWERLSAVTFHADNISRTWSTLGLPLAAVRKVNVVAGTVEGLLALADMLPGTLDVDFPMPPPLRYKYPHTGVAHFVFFTVIMRSHSHPLDERSREFEGALNEHGDIRAFSIPALADRVVRLGLVLFVWEEFVALPSFGPFNALEELVITLHIDVEFPSAAPSKLSCPNLQRLVLFGQEREVDLGALTDFALAALPAARFPLRLKLEGIDFKLTGMTSDSAGPHSTTAFIIEDE